MQRSDNSSIAYVVWFSGHGTVKHAFPANAAQAHRIAISLRAAGYDVRVERA